MRWQPFKNTMVKFVLIWCLNKRWFFQTIRTPTLNSNPAHARELFLSWVISGSTTINFCLMLDHFSVISFIYYVHHYYSTLNWHSYLLFATWSTLESSHLLCPICYASAFLVPLSFLQIPKLVMYYSLQLLYKVVK